MYRIYLEKKMLNAGLMLIRIFTANECHCNQSMLCNVKIKQHCYMTGQLLSNLCLKLIALITYYTLS